MRTAATFGLKSDTYATAAALAAAGLTVGMVVQDPNTGHERMLVKNTTGTLAANAALKFVTPASYVVGPVTASGDYTIGANDLVGSTVTDSYYFWMTTKGFMTVLLATSINAGVIVASNGTSGTLGTVVETALDQRNIVSCASSGSGGATLCYKD